MIVQLQRSRRMPEQQFLQAKYASPVAESLDAVSKAYTLLKCAAESADATLIKAEQTRDEASTRAKLLESRAEEIRASYKRAEREMERAAEAFDRAEDEKAINERRIENELRSVLQLHLFNHQISIKLFKRLNYK